MLRLYSLVNSIHISNKIIDLSKSFFFVVVAARESGESRCHGQWNFYERTFRAIKTHKALKFASLFFIAH